MTKAKKQDGITLTPNFTNMRQRFQQDARFAADHVSELLKGNEEHFGAVRRLIVSLNIACQSIDSVEALADFREVLSTIATAIAAKHDAVVYQQDQNDDAEVNA